MTPDEIEQMKSDMEAGTPDCLSVMPSSETVNRAVKIGGKDVVAADMRRRQRVPRLEAEVLRLREALEDLRKSAAMLQQNAEGCYGEEFAIHGLPGWLADTKASISRAAALTYGGDDAA